MTIGIEGVCSGGDGWSKGRADRLQHENATKFASGAKASASTGVASALGRRRTSCRAIPVRSPHSPPT